MILFRYILRNIFLPFLFALFTLMSVFMLQFFMKIADKLIGKGLSFFVIAKLITYSLSWMFVLAVPMAVLVATLMAFGTMAQNNEIAIMKASGISLYKIMIPPLFFSIVVGSLLVQFNNRVYPDANHELRILLEDISRQKPMLSLVPGVFSQEIRHYSILAREIDAKTNLLKNLVIYDQSKPPELNIITAKRGKIYLSKDQKKMIFDLFNGEIHTSDRTEEKKYRKIIFSRHKIALDASQFVFRETTFDKQRGDRELSAQAMLVIVDSLEKEVNRLYEEMTSRVLQASPHTYLSSVKPKKSSKLRLKLAYLRAQDIIKSSQNTVNSILRRIKSKKIRISSYRVEIHKKYAIPFACIVFILIGVPLGTMTRKSGAGVAATISLLFFLVYWAFLLGGEKLADRGILSPFWGIWSANIVLGFLGLILLIKSARERITLNLEVFQKLIPKQWRVNPENSR